jgi:prefoldin subunit 5
LRYAPYWVTAERTQQTLDKLTEQFCRYLGSCVERLKTTSASLASEVEKLKNILSTSDTVEHRDDGTVEITLGGVRYIGTVVKE